MRLLRGLIGLGILAFMTLGVSACPHFDPFGDMFVHYYEGGRFAIFYPFDGYSRIRIAKEGVDLVYDENLSFDDFLINLDIEYVRYEIAALFDDQDNLFISPETSFDGELVVGNYRDYQLELAFNLRDLDVDEHFPVDLLLFIQPASDEERASLMQGLAGYTDLALMVFRGIVVTEPEPIPGLSDPFEVRFRLDLPDLTGLRVLRFGEGEVDEVEYQYSEGILSIRIKDFGTYGILQRQ